MKIKFALTVLLAAFSFNAVGQSNNTSIAAYTPAKAPLRQSPYIELPLGAIKPQGWLREMLIRQKTGATGNLDKLYPLVMGKRNGWLGGDGDLWERGPYWIDGLLPLAYILQDKELIAKVKPWIEWSLKSQRADGYFGPSKDLGPENGIQRDNAQDWWPKMVMLKVMQQYYSATADKRVIPFMTNYFKYQLQELPKNHLDHWTFWARYRGGDNLAMVYWLYNKTGDKFLLDLAEVIHKQTFDYTNAFLNTELLQTDNSIHGVNLAEGMKEPIIYYQHHPEAKYADAMVKGFKDLRKYNESVPGMFGGDESLHGNNPTQGSELCSAVEMMYTLENTLAITGNVGYADHLEKVAFNVMPTQVDENFVGRQYFQQANQVMLTRATRNFDVNHDGTDVCYGILTGYACCTSNMHQGWPKFAQNLWYATPDKGLAALVYSPSEVKAYVGNNTEVSFKEETNYPFDETIKFTYGAKKGGLVTFPFHLRIPEWCTKATIKINGTEFKQADGNQIVIMNRAWKTGDVVELNLPMHISKNVGYENSISVQRGPIVYALKIGEEVKEVKNTKDAGEYGDSYTEIRPTTPWNYGLVRVDDKKLDEAFKVENIKAVGIYPWTTTNAPLQIKAKGRRIPSWGLYNDSAGPLPFSTIWNLETSKEEEELILIPYGCSRLRITQFPVIDKR
ncbi:MULTISPECIES: beta-L-arabinofuranosidase domain-containing protein [unclassified Mucilaginibacter]|uniref:beta-L-arabinofuranosidase domain-containing protein n=1 Tax=unclassified Mucilaginibacter TaxID=2617802 RepID=UPI002AC94471|nr:MULTISPECIES: beta-L-arabinofuranosidase domain-containing protein [unclassified Mucilaginibacter]MEB0263053.1 glycoside hydrolase family 127 protein [Mucilaginibacter sp. 10I4]MEB0277901.1 glycoside hydrolase family 127 protein [Mucilaginibacter sp. 10B2]MEB0302009.1 glycoside hydrolase family 127 protein [Mucilaginibacter sp. 5C4]WPX22792.1 glycoside hydrolase family 127 protein [Mucilaginibacter sp. 5C4]